MIPLFWVEDDAALRRVYRGMLASEGYAVREAADATSAQANLDYADLVLLDLMLPPTGRPEEGLAVLDEIMRVRPTAKVVVLTGVGDRSLALEAVRRGAHDFLPKPVDPDVLLVVLRRAAAMAALEAEVRQLKLRLAPGGIVGSAPSLLAAIDLVDRVAPTGLPVLVTGEHGTGKELFARRVHDRSRRAQGPFVAVNCGALPPTLLESTLFGHTRGAFTGADRAHKGLFLEADGGTLFLDEVGELEPATQVRLLRALEAGEVLPVGADRPTKVDVRIVSATNRVLSANAGEPHFRDDLYWRLKGIEVGLPPLRDRGDDILLLARFFLDGSAPLVGRVVAISRRAEAALLAHPWPGNLRELRHTMQRAAVMAGPSGVVEPADLGLAAVSLPDGDGLAAQVEAVERRAIAAALAAEGGNKSRAATRLGLSRQGLLNKLTRYEMGADD